MNTRNLTLIATISLAMACGNKKPANSAAEEAAAPAAEEAAAPAAEEAAAPAEEAASPE